MGHILSRKGTNPKAEKNHLRAPLRGKVPPSPRTRTCFLRGPCMLCFLVHSASPPAAKEQPSASLLCTAVKPPENRNARRLLRWPPVAVWEERGRCCRRLLFSSLLFSPPPSSARRGFFGSGLESSEAPAEMVCKRKGIGLRACPPRKQPRCATLRGNAAGAEAPSPPPETAGCQQVLLPEQHLCPLPRAVDCAREGSPKDSAGEDGKGLIPTGSSSQLPELDGREKHEPREPYCEEPPENPGDCCQDSQPPVPDINQLPPSILLKIFSNLSLNERCLSASLVCKYWRDLCLDFQFWKQLDLSSRQQVTDELLERIASRSQNITEINISDCRNVTDTGVCILASKCPGLLKYTAYRCKQLSDASLTAVASQCPQLQKVHVGNQDRLTDEGLKQLGSECRELKDIHFGQCYKISDEGMTIIAKGCLKLRRIYMQENKLVSIVCYTFKWKLSIHAFNALHPKPTQGFISYVSLIPNR
ncbi:F-box/LRR-repeat protein 17 [Python bivittatus]|uniref:F-box/LRR-repeat protein 17 n=1 Tax=Python bivittatus TaxID=176946 RepID=A0A9F5J3K8_PYTBI|nr:F-box/LRR-repeat protein 17 [Python bivittatus]